MDSAEAYVCKQCGAPLDVSPETIVAVCSYCGYPNWIREDLKGDIFVVKALAERDILKTVKKRIEVDKDLKNIKSMIEVGRPFQIYVPYYFVQARAQARYHGIVNVYVRKCSGSGKNRRCWTTTYRVPVSGDYGPYEAVYPIVGRRGVRSFSLNVLGRYYLKKHVKPVRIEDVRWERSSARRILSVEFPVKTAFDIALDSHLDTLRRLVENQMKREAESSVRWRGTVVGSRIVTKHIEPHNIKLRSSPIILLPLYIVPYRFRSGIYRFFVSGWDGVTIVAEEPMKPLRRVLAAAGGSLLAGATGTAAAFLALLGDITLGILSAILFGIGAYGGYIAGKYATSPVKVEVVDERFRVFKEFAGKVKKVAGVVNMAISFDSLVDIVIDAAVEAAVDSLFEDND